MIPRFWRNIPYRYNLIGKKCLNCGEIYFPPRKICRNCRRKGKLVDIKLSGEGEVYTYTVIYVAPEGFEKRTPYIIGIIKLKEGVLVPGEIVDVEPKDVYIGMPVEVCFRKIKEDGEEGLIYYGYKFRPKIF